ncbi:mandelate racemase/muconate lactonizing enzyme family protein [Microbacterium sp.]|uniref:mandelate racemase/muconate lactonizing enzyme family protein n=1 Tax=Microbacterium sp. TaxID=51671 RepID=UPI002631A068|nr:mandelate racemase/muconate lactonizing enzyme family protein [Microbacterium sp.]
MTVITSASAHLVDIPVETVRTDAIQSFQSQETVFVDIATSDGHAGRGYSYTIGTGGSAVLALVRDVFLPQLVGMDVRRTEHIWNTLFASTRATAPGAITSLALAAVDTAVWDVNGRREDTPLWVAAGGYRNELDCYDTENGWLHLSIDELVEGVSAVEASGMRAAKVKVGKPTVHGDVERLRAVRAAVGDDFEIFVDAIQSFTVAEAIRRAAAYADLGIGWLEEPLPADNVAGHAQLARHSAVPIAVGETLYSVGQFQTYVDAEAASIIQVDVARVGGITPWLKVAHLSEAANIPVAPHFLMELHVSLACAVPNGMWVEHIPQLRGVMHNEIAPHAGMVTAPDSAGLGIVWNDAQLAAWSVDTADRI